MKNLFFKFTLAMSATFAFAAFSIDTNLLYATPYQVQGTDGADGADGADGNPGGDGQKGQNGGAAQITTQVPSATAIGGTGGKGGAGGDGIGGPFADGGQGGTGGTGGFAQAIVNNLAGNASAIATGGNGGDGGVGGSGSNGGLMGFGGFGGFGGSALAEAHGGALATAIAYGGNSGASGGTPFSNSLRGGNVVAKASATNALGNALAQAWQYGGNGGTSGGQGANAVMNNNVSGGSHDTFSAEQFAFAGSGGDGVEGVGGNGGAALSIINQSNFNSLGGHVAASLNAIGGKGGFSQEFAYDAGHGGNARVGATISGTGNLSVIANATGGNGGDHLSGRSSGNGGRAFLDPSTLQTTATNSIQFSSELVGGNGGDSNLNTRIGWGKGGDAVSFNAVRALGSSHALSISQTLIGGNAGAFGNISNADRYVGLAGRANGRIGDISNSGSKNLSLAAFGGAGGDFLPPPGSTNDWAGGNGGSATAIIYSKNTMGSTNLNVFALGGDIGTGGVQLISPLGFLGFGGTALASAYADNEMSAGDVSVTTQAIGGNGLNLPALNGGGSAKSYATAVNTSGFNASANASSATQNSSDGSVSRATAKSGTGNTSAISLADGRYVGTTLDVLGSSASATSFSETAGGTANSMAEAISGNLQTSVASATSFGRYSSSNAQSTGGDADWSTSGLRAGSAAAFAVSESSDSPATSSIDPFVETWAHATAQGGDFITAGDVSGLGGNAKAVARGTATSLTSGDIEVSATAIGGRGQNSTSQNGRAGFAESIARGTTTAVDGSANVTAISDTTWQGRANANADAGYRSVSSAEIKSGGAGIVQSTANSFNSTQAISTALTKLSGPSATLGDGRASLFSRASTSGNSVNSAVSTITATVNATTDSAAVFGSSRSTAGHHQNGNELGIASGTSEIFAHQELFPTSTYSTAFIGGNTVIGDTFSNPNDIYGMGELGHNAGIDGAFLATMVMSLDVVGTEDLMIGFFDVASSGNGFETFGMSIKMEGATVLSQSFGTLASATAFFDNQVYSLGDLSTIDGPLDLEISWAVNTTALDSFSSRFVFGKETITMLGPSNFTAIPEPSTLVFLGLLGTTAVLQRRRR